MDKILGNYLTQPNRDFPLDCETLDYIQGLTAMVSVLGNAAGDRVVLCGCESNAEGTRRGEGYVFVRTRAFPEGEVLRWEGGPTGSGMYVREEDVVVNANNVDYPKAYTRRSLAPGIGEENFGWESFTDIMTLKVLMEENAALREEMKLMERSPLGMVEMWAGAELPEGYALCNGQELRKSAYPELYGAIGNRFSTGTDANGAKLTTQEGFFRVPDLRGRFVVGVHDTDTDYEHTGMTGGKKQVTLTADEMPKHTHGYGRWGVGSGDWKAHGANSYPNATTNFSTVWGGHMTTPSGSGAAHENRPPYYVLAYIMRTK